MYLIHPQLLFINEINICKSWDKYYVDFTHANEYNGVTFTSTLYHFLWNKIFGDFVTDAGVIHLSDNLSDHSPVYCTFKIPRIYNRATPTSNAGTTNAIPRWKKASDTQKQDYFNDTQTDLRKITIPSFVSDCQDVHCKNEQHKAAVDDLMLEVLRSVEKSANRHIPKLTDSNSKPNSKIPEN